MSWYRPARKVVFLALFGWLACGAAALPAQEGSEGGSDDTNSGTRITRDQYRLMISVLMRPGVGLQVYSVQDGGPATKLVKQGEPEVHGALDPGDYITRVDGQPVRSLQDFYRKMNASAANGGKVVIRVRDRQTGQEIDWEAQAVKGEIPANLLPPDPKPDPIPDPDPDPTPEPRPDPTPPSERHLYVLLCGLTNDAKIGEAQKKNLANMRDMLREQIPSDRMADLRVIQGSDCNAARILATVDAMQVSQADSLFCYYGGHGAYDASRAAGDPSGGHFFQIPGRDLMRNTLLKHMFKKQARMTVLISDTCNVRSVARPGIAMAPMAIPLEIKPMESLLLHHRGVVDISASSRGQYSWNGGHFGGWFTFSLCLTVRRPECAQWSPALRLISAESNDLYHKCRRELLTNPRASIDADTRAALQGQPDMIPQAFRMNVQRD